MTLIPAFRCVDGAIIAADSQETIGALRLTRQKITPFKIGNFDLAVGGAGEHGDLLDSFVQRIRDEIETSPPSTMASLKRFIQEQLKDYIADEIRHFPKTQRSMRFVIGVHSDDPPDFEIWETKGSRLIRIDTFALVGVGQEYYFDRPVQRLYKPSLTISRAIPLAMYILELAEDTSNYVRGPFSVAVLTKHYPIVMEHSVIISDFAEMTRLYTAQLESMLLQCADIAMSSSDFEKKFKEFQETILQLRLEYFQTAMHRNAIGFFGGRWPNLPYRTTPPDTAIALNIAVSKEDMDYITEIREKMKEVNESLRRMRSALPTFTPGE